MKIKSMLVVGCGVLALASCNKEEIGNTPINQTNNTRSADADGGDLSAYFEMTERTKTDEFANFYSDMMHSRTQVFSVGAGRPFTIVGDGGTILSSETGDFITLDGDAIDGEVEIELIEVFNKADMILLDKATSGVNEAGNAVDALISGGEIFVRATQGGVEVQLADALRVQVPTATPDFDMIKFVEAETLGDDLLWEVADDPAMEVEEDDKGEGRGFLTSFNILPGEWGWTNIDKWAGDPCAKTSIYVDVPPGYDATNTEVYLSYDGDPGRLANFDMWDSAMDMFTEHYGQICIGLPCHFIAVTNSGGGLEYAIQGATIVPGHIEVIAGFTPITEAALIAAINALP